MHQRNGDVSQDNTRLRAELDYRGRPARDATDPPVTAMVQPVILEEGKQVGHCIGTDKTKVLSWLPAVDEVSAPLDVALLAA